MAWLHELKVNQMFPLSVYKHNLISTHSLKMETGNNNNDHRKENMTRATTSQSLAQSILLLVRSIQYSLYLIRAENVCEYNEKKAARIVIQSRQFK